MDDVFGNSLKTKKKLNLKKHLLIYLHKQPQAYLEHSRTYTMKLFAKIVHG